MACCDDDFDADELGLDPEEDVDVCERCGEPLENCECDEEDDDATA